MSILPWIWPELTGIPSWDSFRLDVLGIKSIQVLLLVATIGFFPSVTAIESAIISTAGKLLEFLLLVLNLLL